jgi:uncharacterized repeat protein (TIGR03803 family)
MIRISPAAVTVMLSLTGSVQAATFTTLYSFSKMGKDAPNFPLGRLKHLGDALYGVTFSDGHCDSARCGTIYKYNLPRAQVGTLHVFQRPRDGGSPATGLCEYDQNLYGTTQKGGPFADDGPGVIYRLDPSTNKETVLYAFKNFDEGDTDYHGGELIANDGSLFGTMPGGARKGGTTTRGTLFQYDLASGHYNVLHQFATKFGSPDGIMPAGSPVFFGKSLFGLTSLGGTAGLGTIYKYDTVTGREKIVHSFADEAGNGNQPADHLVKQGKLLYGITNYGGAAEGGTFFSFDPHTSAFNVLYEFGASAGDGTLPQFAPVYSNGSFYGTTRQGGAHNFGTVYRFDPASGQETVLYSFTGSTDGKYPADLMAVKGVLYGTVFSGGMSKAGSIYSVVP